MMVFTASKRSLVQDNVFTPVCQHSVHRTCERRCGERGVFGERGSTTP